MVNDMSAIVGKPNRLNRPCPYCGAAPGALHVPTPVTATNRPTMTPAPNRPTELLDDEAGE
jgi:hypothetical protein